MEKVLTSKDWHDILTTKFHKRNSAQSNQIEKYLDNIDCERMTIEKCVDDALKNGNHLAFSKFFTEKLVVLNNSYCFREYINKKLDGKKYRFLKSKYWLGMVKIDDYNKSKYYYDSQTVNNWKNLGAIPPRDIVLQIAIAIGLNRAETNILLMKSGYICLYPIDEFDAVIINELESDNVIDDADKRIQKVHKEILKIQRKEKLTRVDKRYIEMLNKISSTDDDSIKSAINGNFRATEYKTTLKKNISDFDSNIHYHLQNTKLLALLNMDNYMKNCVSYDDIYSVIKPEECKDNWGSENPLKPIRDSYKEYMRDSGENGLALDIKKFEFLAETVDVGIGTTKSKKRNQDLLLSIVDKIMNQEFDKTTGARTVASMLIIGRQDSQRGYIEEFSKTNRENFIKFLIAVGCENSIYNTLKETGYIDEGYVNMMDHIAECKFDEIYKIAEDRCINYVDCIMAYCFEYRKKLVDSWINDFSVINEQRNKTEKNFPFIRLLRQVSSNIQCKYWFENNKANLTDEGIRNLDLIVQHNVASVFIDSMISKAEETKKIIENDLESEDSLPNHISPDDIDFMRGGILRFWRQMTNRVIEGKERIDEEISEKNVKCWINDLAMTAEDQECALRNIDFIREYLYDKDRGRRVLLYRCVNEDEYGKYGIDSDTINSCDMLAKKFKEIGILTKEVKLHVKNIIGKVWRNAINQVRATKEESLEDFDSYGYYDEVLSSYPIEDDYLEQIIIYLQGLGFVIDPYYEDIKKYSIEDMGFDEYIDENTYINPVLFVSGNNDGKKHLFYGESELDREESENLILDVINYKKEPIKKMFEVEKCNLEIRFDQLRDDEYRMEDIRSDIIERLDCDIKIDPISEKLIYPERRWFDGRQTTVFSRRI